MVVSLQGKSGLSPRHVSSLARASSANRRCLAHQGGPWPSHGISPLSNSPLSLSSCTSPKLFVGGHGVQHAVHAAAAAPPWLQKSSLALQSPPLPLTSQALIAPAQVSRTASGDAQWFHAHAFACASHSSMHSCTSAWHLKPPASWPPRRAAKGLCPSPPVALLLSVYLLGVHGGVLVAAVHGLCVCEGGLWTCGWWVIRHG